MNNKRLAEEIIAYVGGKSNIVSVTHCVTRLRFNLNDDSLIEVDELENTNGVIGLSQSGGQFQVIIGPTVSDVYEEVVEQTGLKEENNEQQAKGKRTIIGIAKQALDTMISCFVPAIPVIAGSGMIKVLAVLLNYVGWLDRASSTFTILNTIGDSVFYFLPFFVAYNAAKKMNVDVFLSMVLAAILLHPNFLTLGEAGSYSSFFGMSMKIVNYSSQAIPVIFAVWLLKYVDKYANKFSPSVVKVFLRPMLSLLIVAPIMLIIIGPAAALLGDGFFVIVNIMNQWGWLAVGINAALFPLMVLTGTHNVTIPLLVQMFATQGFDSIFLPSGLAGNIAEAGAAGAVAFKTKNKVLRSTAISATVSALLGITEPALYGVNLRLKRPFIAMLIGALLGGCYIGILGITAPTFVTPSVLTAPIFAGSAKNMLLGLSSIPVTFIITFVITYFIGFEDLTDTNDAMIKTPVKGKVIDLELVNDKAFSTKSMGEGFAVAPSEGKVIAPFDAEVIFVFPTKHAIGLKRTDGLEMLIHVGLDTVNLKGEHFNLLVKQGDYIKEGQTILEFDKAAIEMAGYDSTTVVVITNSKDYKQINLKETGELSGNSEVLYVK